MSRTIAILQLAAAALLGLFALGPGHALAQYNGMVDYGCDAFIACDECPSSNCGPRWTATADAIFLHRDDPSSGILALNTDSPSEILNANDFNFGTQAGIDLTLACSLSNGHGMQLRYFGIDDWDATQNVSTTFDDLLQFNAAPPVFVTSGDAITSTYASKLHSAEFNLTHQVSDWLGLLAGFRYLELNEGGVTNLVDSTLPYTYSAATSNHLYGGQLGMQAWLWSYDRFRVDVSGNAGVYGNHSRQSSSIATNAATVFASGSDDRVAFVGEAALTGTVCLTDCLKLRGGYRLLWLDGVALATDQLAVSNFNDGLGYDGSGDVFYHGAFAGIELCH